MKYRAYRWPAAVITLTLFITLLPYLYGYLLSNHRIFLWLGYNFDDACVYLSWMRQAAEGSFRTYDLFTTSVQPGMPANPLFWCMGIAAEFTHLPLIAVFHAVRLSGGAALLFAVWVLIQETVTDLSARKLSLLFVCFSSGLGWLPIFWPGQTGVSIFSTPVDAWQPEANTFLSLYLSPLFVISMLLQVSVITLLLRSERRNSISHAAAAGLLTLLLGLIHTYDVVGMSLTWLIYLMVISIKNGWKEKANSWKRALAAGVLAAPGAGAIAYQLHADTVFRKRAEVPTLSPAPIWIILGYGLPLCLALYALYTIVKNQKREEIQNVFFGSDGMLLLAIWAAVQFMAAYLPVAFQRKMLQGEHIPIAILAGAGAAILFKRLSMPKRYTLIASVGVTLLLSITNIRFLYRDASDYAEDRVQTDLQRPYLKIGEENALNWIKTQVPLHTAVQPLPWVTLLTGEDGHTKLAPIDMTMACYLPAATGHHVYCGHWGETPEYGKKLLELARFALPTTSNTERIDMLRKMKVQYLLFSQKSLDDPDADNLEPMFRGRINPPSFLKIVYSNPDVDIYKVEDGYW